MATEIEIIRKEFVHELNDVKFSARKELFRARITSTLKAVVVWLENKKTKAQWETHFKNVSNAGNNGHLPEDVVVESLRRALSSLKQASSTTTASELDVPSATLDFTSGKAVLALHLSLMGGIWKNVFTFPLLPVELDKVDVLEAKLRDAEEDITALKSELKAKKNNPRPAFMSVSSITPTGHSAIIVWGGDAPNNVAASHFTLSEDKKQVTLRREGLYQVSVSVAGHNNGNGHHLGLQLNGADIAVCYRSDRHDYQNTAHIFEILPLKAGDVLQVRSGFGSNSLADPKGNRFTILFLGD